MLALRTTKNSSGISDLELLIKRKFRTQVPLPNVNVNTTMKLKKPPISQSRELQPLDTNGTVRYRQNNSWSRTKIILNKNDMPRSYTLSSAKDNVIQRNRYHLIKMDSNFDETKNDNDIETEPKTRHIT